MTPIIATPTTEPLRTTQVHHQVVATPAGEFTEMTVSLTSNAALYTGDAVETNLPGGIDYDRWTGKMPAAERSDFADALDFAEFMDD